MDAVSQVLRYTRRYEAEGRNAVPWVVAHSVPAAVEHEARRVGVRTRGISMSAVEAFLAAHGTSVSKLMTLRRRAPGALTGGAGDLWAVVDTAAA